MKINFGKPDFKRKNLIFIGISLVGVLVLVSVIIKVVDAWTLVSPPREEKAREIAAQLGIDPSWNSISTYFEHAFQAGMDYEEVNRLIDEIGPHKDYLDPMDEPSKKDNETNQWVYQETIHFLDIDTAKALGKWSFWFDTDWKLVRFFREDS